MDVKAPLEAYDAIAQASVDRAALKKSIALLRSSAIPHEYRLTFAPQLTAEEAVDAALLVKGCNRFYLQQYRPRSESDPKAHAPEYVRETAKKIRQAIGTCTLRGLGPEE
jgi:pyruvate-formate lyase-activating enzyme